MIIKDIEFIGSFEKIESCPVSDLPEYAFIGRSNVGKSSLINLLTGRNALAKISSTPGKTQMINYFLINKEWYLVDLPGYGYAQVSKTKRAKWKKNIDIFLKERRNLYCIFSLIDSRHELQKLDLEFVNWLGENNLPFVFVFTKIDKLKKAKLESNVNAIVQSLLEFWESLPRYFLTSIKTEEGKEELLNFIQKINNN